MSIFMDNRYSKKRGICADTGSSIHFPRSNFYKRPLMHTLETRMIAYNQNMYVHVYPSLQEPHIAV